MAHGLHADALALTASAVVGCVAGFLAARAAGRASSDGEYRQTALICGVGVVAGMAIGARFGMGLELTAFLLLVAVALPLSAIDVAVRKVPDRILIPATPAAIALLALASHSAGTYSALGRALLAGVVTFGAYLVLAVVTGQLGLGDCKAAGFCGVFLGYLGWKTAVFGAFVAFVLAAVVAVLQVARMGSARAKTLAFAPYIFAGAILAIAVSG